MSGDKFVNLFFHTQTHTIMLYISCFFNFHYDDHGKPKGLQCKSTQNCLVFKEGLSFQRHVNTQSPPYKFYFPSFRNKNAHLKKKIHPQRRKWWCLVLTHVLQYSLHKLHTQFLSPLQRMQHLRCGLA